MKYQLLSLVLVLGMDCPAQVSPKLHHGYANPIVDCVFTADPTAVEHEGRLYVYGTNDTEQYEQAEKNSYEKIKTIAMMSTDDMVNWTYHGNIPVGKIAPWIMNSWAPSIVKRVEADGKTHFYLYFSNSGFGTGVITATSPVGPWTSPLDKSLVDANTEGLGDCRVPFDPGAVIDEQGVGWIAFGGGKSRIARLGKDMVSLNSELVNPRPQHHFEANELNFIGGKYVYTYNLDWEDHSDWKLSNEVPTRCCMAYMTSTTPLDSMSWHYENAYLDNPGEFEGFTHSNNHTHLHKFQGKWYVFYHTEMLQDEMGIEGGFRSMQVDEIEVDEERVHISPAKMTKQGVRQTHWLNPYERQQAETVAATEGIKFVEADEVGNMVAMRGKAFVKHELPSRSILLVRGVDFGKESKLLTAHLRGKGTVEMRLDNIDAPVVATLTSKGEDWQEQKVACRIGGIHDLVFTLTGEVQMDDWMFRKESPVPTKDQLALQDMEMYAFIHYALNTYTDQEWGYGNEDVKLFNPQHLDCQQWVRTCKNAGMKGIIFTAKHHCGFCMWPSAYTDYSVKNTPWKDGKGDVVKELAEACRREGLKFAVYLSPWDRNHPEYGRKEYVTYFRNQLRELLTNYGEVFEVWFDGANGGNGWYGGADEVRTIDRLTYYEWGETYEMIRALQPHCVIWNDGADRRGDLRWVGTEAGVIGETNWSMLNSTGDVPYGMLHYGVEDGDVWVPGETNTSIRPGWFYHDSENGHVKSLSKLMETYYKSVGRNSTLLLNFPIDKDGLIHAEDSIRGAAFYAMVRQIFDHPLKTRKKLSSSVSTLTFKQPTRFNRLMVGEDIRKGQQVKRFKVEALVDGVWTELQDILSEEPWRSMTTIGRKRILCFPTTETTQIRLTILDTKDVPVIRTMEAYLAPEIDADRPENGEKRSSAYYVFFPGVGSPVQSMFIGLGKEMTVRQFRFLPSQDTKEGMPLDYTLSISPDNGQTWTVLAKGEFSNIVNNPIWQTINCTPATGSLLKLDCSRITSGNRIFYADMEAVE